MTEQQQKLYLGWIYNGVDKADRLNYDEVFSFEEGNKVHVYDN